MTSKAQVRCKAVKKALHGFTFLSEIDNLLWFLAKKWVKIPIDSSFWLKLDDVIVMNISFHKLTLIPSYSMPKFVKIECHLHG